MTLRQNIFIILLAVQFATPAISQNLELIVEDVNLDAYPLIRINASLFENGIPVSPGQKAHLKLIDNGIDQDVRMSCAGDENYIGMYLNNIDDDYDRARTFIYSWDDPQNPIVNTALHILGRLNSDSHAAVWDNRSIQVGDDGFNSDHSMNRDRVMNMPGTYAGASQPIYRTYNGLGRLASLPDRKYLVMLGADISLEFYDNNRLMVVPPEDIADILRRKNIPVYIFTFLNRELGTPTGYIGRTYYWFDLFTKISGGKLYELHPKDTLRLEEVAEEIAEDIHSQIDAKYCTISYTAEGCTDSVRTLELTVELNGQIATASTVITTPSRPDTLALTVSSESDDVVPPQSFDVYLHLEPHISTAFLTSFSFSVHYPPHAFEVQAPLLSDGTMMSENYVDIVNIHDEGFTCTIDYGRAIQSNGNLLGFTLRAPRPASSRPAFITIDSLTFENGCPNTVITYPDTVYICRCEKGLDVAIENVGVVTEEEIRLPVTVRDVRFSTNPIFTNFFTTKIQFNREYLEPIGVDGIGALTNDALLGWRIEGGDTLVVYADESFVAGESDVLFYARFRVKQPKAAVESHLSVPYVRAFSDCCYGLEKTSTTSILIDGECEKIVRRAGEFTLAQNAPNPARGETSFRFTVHSKGALDGKPAHLTLYRSDGKAIAELYNQSITDGEYTIPYSTADLPAGMYYIVLTIGKDSQTRSVVVE